MNQLQSVDKSKLNLGEESEIVEFKKSTSEINEAIIDITAMLNKHGKGTLYFGIKNDGEICEWM